MCSIYQILFVKKSFKYWQFWLYNYLYTHATTGPVATSEKELGISYLIFKSQIFCILSYRIWSIPNEIIES